MRIELFYQLSYLIRQTAISHVSSSNARNATIQVSVRGRSFFFYQLCYLMRQTEITQVISSNGDKMANIFA